MSNLEIYNNVRKVPQEAQKKIGGGRLSGMTDINPMWRIKALTEQFGPVGIGWYPEIVKEWLEHGANDEIAAFMTINLFVKFNGEWSKPIPGTGGSMFVSKEKNGMYTSDECYKMAYTDAISVACKALGFGADIYWDKDNTKYSVVQNDEPRPNKTQLEAVAQMALKKGVNLANEGRFWTGKASSKEWTMSDYTKVANKLEAMQDVAS